MAANFKLMRKGQTLICCHNDFPTPRQVMECDEGYLPSSAGCTSCASGFYPQLQTCERCPPKADAVVNGFGIVVFVCGFVLIAITLAIIGAKRTGAPYSAAFKLLKDYVKWTMVTWQTIVQVRWH